MATLAHASRWIVEAVLRPLDALAPWASLAIVAVLTAAIMLTVVRWVSPQRQISRARARMAAAVLEMRIYLDQPRRMLAAQGRLIAWTAAYLACLLPALVVLALPLGALYLQLEIRHGLAPLPVPSTAIVRIALADGVAPGDVVLEPAGAVAITARVRAPDEPAVYARVAIRAPGTHALTVRVGDEVARKQLVADVDADRVAPERRAGLAALWAVGDEPPLDGDAIRAITLAHPARASTLPVRWWLYWLGLATVVALLLRRRFGVVF